MAAALPLTWLPSVCNMRMHAACEMASWLSSVPIRWTSPGGDRCVAASARAAAQRGALRKGGACRVAFSCASCMSHRDLEGFSNTPVSAQSALQDKLNHQHHQPEAPHHRPLADESWLSLQPNLASCCTLLLHASHTLVPCNAA